VPEFESEELLVEVIKPRTGDYPPVIFDTHMGLNNG
jgi:hypothetical protein